MVDMDFANLIYLHRASELDMIYHDEDEIDSLNEHIRKLEEQICRELGIPGISAKFLIFNWYGQNDELPWSNNGSTFYPDQMQVIVPVTGTFLSIRGENRKIALTCPPTYDGKQPCYLVSTSERQLDEVRVLQHEIIGAPFRGIEKIFMPHGFNSLPRLKDSPQTGLMAVNTDQIIVPSNSISYL